ncbi:DUF6882 domain-containing protein [Nocardia sp. CC227C]|uniref:DUF6882 domain-containing protein n=1 Tax=Nocardia sp. CC227C TaxID=3044562 RepID=UPI0035569BEC
MAWIGVFTESGSAVPDQGSWLWSWANRSGFPEAVSSLAAMVHDYGVAHDVNEPTPADHRFTGSSASRNSAM